MKKTTSPANGISTEFFDRFGSQISGVLCGFDRLRLRGTLRYLFQPTVMEAYLNACRILIKDFGAFAQKITDRVKAAAYQAAELAGRPVLYLNSSQRSKEDIAREVARRDGVSKGLIAVLSAVEPCQSYSVRGDRESKRIHLVLEQRKCLFLYHYFVHPLFGFMHARVQTWFPFTIDLCLNGREWLAQQMDGAGIGYLRRENCFVAIEDWKKAQALADEQLKINWSTELGRILNQVHPTHREICRPIAQEYYWSASASEYATDIAFERPENLAALYPRFVHHAMSSFSSPDVMRFLGRWVPTTSGKVFGQFKGEIRSDLKKRPEGVRIKHSVNGNSIKAYDKQGSVLRVETTINHSEEFKVYRPSERDPKGPRAWRELRRGVADMARRAEVSRASNQRYLEALASTTASTPVATLVAKVCSPVTVGGKRCRALRPWSPEDGLLLETLADGKFVLNGFRNRDLRQRLGAFRHHDAKPQTITRKLRLLRAHGIIRKAPKTHRYMLTLKGRTILTALQAARQADVDRLSQIAA
jgi:DNA-binding HxlR family transcriptional regulator